MNKQIIIDTLNKPYEVAVYKLSSNGRIYTEFLGKKTYFSADTISEMFKSANAIRNAFAAKAWIENNGGEMVGASSKAGSWYYNFKGMKVRISDHCWTSQYHNAPDVNLCSYDLNGHVELINQLATLAD